jgi:hypothetical protein
MPLPDFNPPTLAELRALWKAHRGDDEIARLILEVQHQRLLLLELKSLIDAGVYEVRRMDPTLPDQASPLTTLKTRLAREVLRVGEIDDRPKPIVYPGMLINRQ